MAGGVQRAQAFFLPAPPLPDGSAGGQRFCIYHAPADGAPAGNAALVYLHPFAEEMNKSRRMVALQARALAAAGHAVLQIDLLGCGDSSGDFGDASWDAWIADALLALDWLHRRHPAARLTLWGLRAGCLLAAEAAVAAPADCRPSDFVFWQPVTTGKAALQQWLRLAAAAAMADGNGKGVVQRLKETLAAGGAVDIAGYRLQPALAHGLERAALTVPHGAARLHWFELSMQPEADLLPGAAAPLAAWRGAGVATAASVVAGPAFWQTTEIETATALLHATVAAVAAATTVAIGAPS